MTLQFKTPPFEAYYHFIQLSDNLKEKNNIKTNAKTPRYDCIRKAGFYEPMESLKNKDGILYAYLSETRGIINSPDRRRADRFLHTSKSLNISSVYLMLDPVPNLGFVGFGNPDPNKTYGGKNKKPNPFFNYRNDAFLFVVSEDWESIEMLILSNGKFTIESNEKRLADGYFDETLAELRKVSQPFFDY